MNTDGTDPTEPTKASSDSTNALAEEFEVPLLVTNADGSTVFFLATLDRARLRAMRPDTKRGVEDGLVERCFLAPQERHLSEEGRDE